MSSCRKNASVAWSTNVRNRCSLARSASSARWCWSTAAAWLAPTVRNKRSSSLGKAVRREPATSTPACWPHPMRTTTTRTVPAPTGFGMVGAGSIPAPSSQGASARPMSRVWSVWRRSARGAGDFDLLPVCLPGQTEINQVQAQRREQHVREALGDLKRSVAGPDGGERREGDQVPHGAAKCSDFVGDFFHCSRGPLNRPRRRSVLPVRGARAGIRRAARRTGSPGGCRQ